MTTPHMSQVRQSLLETLADLRDRSNPMEVDRARAVAQVAAVLVDSAKTEIDYIKAVKGEYSSFIDGDKSIALSDATPTAHNPFPVVARHRLEG